MEIEVAGRNKAKKMDRLHNRRQDSKGLKERDLKDRK